MAGTGGRTRLPAAGEDDPGPDRRWFALGDGGRLVSTDAGGTVVWDGLVDGVPALDVHDLGDGRHALVRLPDDVLKVDDHGRILERGHDWARSGYVPSPKDG